jgi:predicted secreted protein
VIINKEDDGKTKTIMLENFARIELPLTGGTGYSWHLNNLDPEYFEVVKEETLTQPENTNTGAPTTNIWHLRTRIEGTTYITFYCYRDWEGIEKSSDHLKVKIIITPMK